MLNSAQLAAIEGTERKKDSTRLSHLLTDVSFFHLWILPRIPDVTDSSPSEGGLVRKKITFHII